MKLKVFNNLTRKKEEFNPQDPNEVKFYSCGPTTYDFLHVGNARALVIGDVFHRVLKVLGFKVNFVRNFTDVDDKIIERAQSLKIDPIEYAQKFVVECETDMKALGMLPATTTPKVSDHMPEIIQMIKDIMHQKKAYEVEGEVFFDVPKFENYGELSKKRIEDLVAGQRVEVDKKKHHPTDFVLWKPAKPNEPSWDSPWGKGRPGWHIECSAMAKKYLGLTLDLHHGGVDLMFPHHENEIAQSESANQCQFCRYWAHNEFLNFGSEKMSKSLGNIVRIRDFNQKYSGLVLRQILISVHYRARIEWSEDVIKRAIDDLVRTHEFLNEFKLQTLSEEKSDQFESHLTEMLKLKDEFLSELANDFNTAGALGHFFSFIRFVRREIYQKPIHLKIHQTIQNFIKLVDEALGCFNTNPSEFVLTLKRMKIGDSKSSLTEEEAKKLLEERKLAKASKDFKRADEIRDIFKSQGLVIKDHPDGTSSWEQA